MPREVFRSYGISYRKGWTNDNMYSLEAMVSATGKAGIMIIHIVFRGCGISYKKGLNNDNGVVFRSYGISYRKGRNNDSLSCH
jgi:hypothetical protein